MKGKMNTYYFYRGEIIERFGRGWCWGEEMVRGSDSCPVYKTIEDAKNAIRKYTDSTHKAEPRIVQTAKWDSAERCWKERRD